MDVTTTDIRNSKTDDFLAGFAFVILGLMAVICISASWYKNRDYSYKTEATLLSYEYITHNRKLIGYTDTYHQSNVPVYAEPYVRDYYECVYVYYYNDVEYQVAYKSYHKPIDKLEIYLNPDEPQNIIFGRDKVSWDEFIEPLQMSDDPKGYYKWHTKENNEE